MHLSVFVQKTWVCAESSLFPSVALTQAEASTGLLGLGAKEFENETHRTMGTARGQGLAACSALPRKRPEETGTLPGMQEVLGNQVSRNRPDPHWSRPPLCVIGQKPGETTAFPRHILLGCQNQLRPYLRSLCWGQVLPQPGPSLRGPRQGKALMSLSRWGER